MKILLQEKRPQDAIDILWSLYKKAPESGLLEYINQIAKTLKPKKNWDQQAIEFHRSQLGNLKHDYEELRHTNHLIALLIDHKDYQEALSVCQKAVLVDAELILEVAEAFKQHADVSIPLVYRVIKAQLKRSNLNNNDYHFIVELFHRIHRCAQVGKQLDVFNRLLLEVRTIYKAKRNLMSYLGAAFSGGPEKRN